MNINSNEKNEIIDITDSVNKEIDIEDGLCVVYCPHTTAAITINENADSTVKRDILYMLKKLVPEDEDFKHSEGNSDAHVKASLMGNSRIIPIEKGKLSLGTWEGIYFCEFDGPRKRNVIIKTIEG